MSKYSGLDKVDLDGLELVEKYSGGKIYKYKGRHGESYTIVKRGYEIDCCFTNIDHARSMIDHFNEG